jgi:hydroxyacyl-ACP dehydratase HTD2-like protein with hotdog domain
MTVVSRPAVGDRIPELVRTPTHVQLFAFSAATGNAHRIHYDAAYARTEGYADVLVQSHLHACFLAQAIKRAWGDSARLRRLGWQNRGAAVPGDELTVTGEVTEVLAEPPGCRVVLSLAEHNQRGELCVRGWATVVTEDE